MKWVFVFSLFVCMSACSGGRVGSPERRSGSEQIAIWRAWRSEGDKPGMGLEIRVSSKGVEGTYVLMDPADPSDFKRGRPVPMKTISESPKRLVFAVHLPGSSEWHFGLRFDHPLAGDSVLAVMEWTQTFELPLEFYRVSARSR
jgi:hypothetical protein